MKIAINLTRDYIGGITTSNLSLMHHLHTHDYEFVGIEITGRMYMKGPTLFRPFAPELFDHHIINIHHLPLKKAVTDKTTLTSLKKHYSEAINLTREILRETKPDVVFLSGTYYIPWIISVAARLEKIPIVLWYSGVLSQEVDQHSIAKKAFYTKMERDIASSAVSTIFPSKLCKTVVENEITRKKIARAYVIPNPLPKLFTESEPSFSSVERRISAIGRYTRIKNFDRFFALHKALNKEGWNHTASFVTSGVIPRGRMPKSVEMLPAMTPEGLKSFYLSQGLIICPSVFETFGNVPMEAVSLGIPVLVSDTMGCAEILCKAGLKNMVVSFNDLPTVADRVKELCGQSVLPKQMNAVRRMLDPYLINEEIRAVITTSYNFYTTARNRALSRAQRT